MKNEVKKWYKNEQNAKKDALKIGGQVAVSSNGWTDIYYVVEQGKPGEVMRVVTRSITDCCGRRRYRVIFYDEQGVLTVVNEATNYRVSQVLQNKIPLDKLYDYLCGYYTRREETSEKIKNRKEAARLSHFYIEQGGTAGHEARQEFRREFLRNKIH